MCGIFGYIGQQQALPILVEGLRRLEYRGYDSTGVSVDDGSVIHTHKTVGKVADLKSVLPRTVEGTRGIAHTRWATHGGVTQVNTHPTHLMTRRYISSTTASLRIISTFGEASLPEELTASARPIQKCSFR